MRPRRNRGQATLSFIILVGGVILEIAIAGSFITYFLSASGLGERLSFRALAAAEAGIRDAEEAITRNKDIGSTNYSFFIGSDTATVSVSQNASNSTSYVYTITSTGVASTRQRKLVAMIVVSKTTGAIQVQSVVEQSVQ